MSDLNALLAQLQSSTGAPQQQNVGGTTVTPTATGFGLNVGGAAPAQPDAASPLAGLLGASQQPAQASPLAGLLGAQQQPPPQPAQTASPLAGLLGSQPTPQSSQQPASPLAGLLGNSNAAAPPPTSPLAGLLGAQPSPPPQPQQQAQPVSPLAGLLGNSTPAQQPAPQASPLAGLLSQQQPTQQQQASPLAGLLGNSGQPNIASNAGAAPSLAGLLSGGSPQAQPSLIQAVPQPATQKQQPTSSASGPSTQVREIAATPKTDMSRAEQKVEPYTKHQEFQAHETVKYDPSKGELKDFITNQKPYALVEIPAGEYLAEIPIVRPVYIRANGKVTIKGKGTSSVFLIASEHCVLEGLTIVQVDTKAGGAIIIQDGFTRIFGCDVSGISLSALTVAGQKTIVEVENSYLHGTFNPCILASDSSRVALYNTKVKRSQTYGVYGVNSSTIHIEGSKISKNNASGVYVIDNARARISGTEVKKNQNCGIEVTSKNLVNIENCKVTGSVQGPGIAGVGGCALSITGCQIVGNDIAGLKISRETLAVTKNNVFQNAQQNVLMMVHDHGTVRSDGDTFQGTCVSAIAAFELGRIECSNASINAVSNTGILCYDQGSLIMSNSVITQTKNLSVQARDGSTLELTDVTINNPQGAGIVVSSNVSGFLKNCKVLKGNSIGAEISDLSNFSVSNCEFVGMRVGGVSLHNKVDVSFSNCKFTENGQIGADLSGKDCNPIFVNCDFSHNKQLGLHVAGGPNAIVDKATITDCGQVGIGAKNCTLKILHADISHIQQAAISVSEAAKVIFEDCSVHDNQNFGCQTHMKGSHAKFINCKFNNHINSVAIVGLQEGVVRCIGCTFESSLHPHAEIRQSSKLSLKKCDLSNTSKGIGIQVHDDGFLKLNETKIHDESKIGIMIGERGTVDAKNSTICNCGTCGLYIMALAKGTFTGCTLSSNGQTAVQMQGGELTLNECIVKDHTAHGIIVTPGATLNDNNNKFINNGQSNIYKA